ncbi:MAG TPA: response regulator [Candidatus Competibacteraceae bacterium]|nr:response regulator [Candidatus Competibacteraceae bacterium]MCP5133234.1 response regulator [Gammaproteobacteria bacterium]HPF58967.1 response regulator [Candidatus Competibacteraceae bacterium]HRY18468.1 response regulator [Candidatus Competibacteraceae bacterium]
MKTFDVAADARILMIDDEPANILFLEQVLNRAGYENILSTSDPREALGLCQSFSPDIVLLDLLMPYLDGFAVMKQLREIIAPDDYRPILILTADISREKKEQALAEGAMDFLTKPLEIPEVLLRLRNLLKTRQLYLNAQQALVEERELNQLKNRFISMVSHEFRTPLSIILSSTELLEHYGRQWPLEKQARHLKRIKTSVIHLNQLIGDVLILGRAEAGRIAFHPRWLDLEPFCRELMEELQLTLGAQHALVTTVEGENSMLWIDPNVLRSILYNLASNAIKFSPEGGPVTLCVQCQSEQIRLIVQDQGIGIPPEACSRLYEAFYRAENAALLPGTGLGLVIVQRLLKAHQGAIEFQSQLHQGTTFTVTFPRIDETIDE